MPTRVEPAIVTLTGLTLASNLSGRPEPELLAQAVDGVLPVWRDANGGFYFDPADLTALPRRAICAVKGCGRPLKVVGLCLCSTHYARWKRGADIGARIQVEKAQRGAKKRERTGQRMRLAAHSDSPETREVVWVGQTVSLRAGAYEDRQAEQLGDPEMWQAVADEALERAWSDLMSGKYAERLAGQLAALRPPKPKTIQSPLMASVRPL